MRGSVTDTNDVQASVQYAMLFVPLAFATMRYSVYTPSLSLNEMLVPPELQFGTEGFALQAYSVPVRIDRTIVSIANDSELES